MPRTGRGFPSHIQEFVARFARSALALSFLSGAGQMIQRSLNPANYTGTVTAYLEVHMFSQTGSIMTARLRNVTTNTVIGASSVTTTSTTETRVRSPGFSLTAGDNTYEVDFGGDTGGFYTLVDAVLLLAFS